MAKTQAHKIVRTRARALARTHTHTHWEDRTHTMPIKSARAPAHTHTHGSEEGRGGGGGELIWRQGLWLKRERERVPDLYSRKAITGQNTVWRGKFEGGEGRAVTESERKRIPDLDSRDKQKARPLSCFLLKKGMRKFYDPKKSAET